MKLMKKSISLLLCVMLLCAMVPITALTANAAATSGNCGTNGSSVKWSFDSSTGVLSFSGSGEMADYVETEYDDGDYYYESSETQPWRSYRSSITSVSIGSGVTSIGSYALYNMTALTGITIPSNIRKIGRYAFEGCSGIQRVDTSSLNDWCSVNFIDGGTTNPLYYAKKLYVNGNLLSENLVISSDVAIINKYAFIGCNLTSLTINDGVACAIGDSAFSGIKTLTNVVLGDSVTSIGANAFSGCTALERIEIGRGLTSIGGDAFYNCKALSGVYISDLAAWCNVTFAKGKERNYRNTNPLYYAYNLYLNGEVVSSLVVPDGVTELNPAFAGSSITSVSIPDTVTSISDYAFDQCEGLQRVTIGNGVTSIGNSAFSSCPSLWKVSIGNNVKSIGDYAFYRNYGLSEITLGNSLESIAKYAFYDCNLLQSIDFPASLKTIGESAFQWCTRLSRVGFGGGVEYVDGYAFSSCDSLRRIDIRNLADWCLSDFKESGHPFYDRSGECDLYLNGTKITNLVIPDGVTKIGDYAFSKTNSLASVTIPSTVNKIGTGSFRYNQSLTRVNMSVGLKTINKEAFYGCSNLYSADIPEGVTDIWDRAFASTNIQDVVIPDSVVYLGREVFRGNQYLQRVVIGTGLKNIQYATFIGCVNLRGLTIKNGVETIGQSAFANCKNITSITIPDSVTSIGSSAFSGCEKLSNLSLGNGLTSIDSYAFSGCKQLKKVVIPEGVKLINDGTFSDCTALELIHIKNSNCSFGRLYALPSQAHVCCSPTTRNNLHNYYGNSSGHSWGDWEIVSAPTCTETGTKRHTCTLCGEIEDGVAPALGHDWVEDLNIPASCTEDGFAIYVCSRCDEEKEETLDALGHLFGDWTTVIEASCTADGTEQRVCTRDDCNETETRVVERLGHNYQAVVTPPSCNEGGYTTYTCSRCGDSYVADEVEALGHKYGDWTTSIPASCTEDGEESRECSNCGDIETRVIEAPGHLYSDWAISIAPSCTTVGEESRVCSRCGDVETRSVNALGHNYEDIVTPASCTEGGYTTHTCSRCGDSYTDNEVEALGHDYTVTVRSKPTATRQGAIKYQCSRCGDNGNKAIPKLSEDDYIISNNTATCTEAGTATYTWKDTSYGICAINDVATQATGHNYGIAPVWTWSGDNTSATATFTCITSGCGHEETVNADITNIVENGKIKRTATAEIDGTTYTDTIIIDSPLDAAFDSAIMAGDVAAVDGNRFNLPTNLEYKKASLLGVQKKEAIQTTSGGTGLRFIAELSSEYVGKDNIDYGFEVVKTSRESTKAFDENGGFNTMQQLIDSGSDNIMSVSCKDTQNNVANPEYGDNDSDSTAYKYVTLSIKNIAYSQGVAVRFYVEIDGVRNYSSYQNSDGTFIGCCTSYNTIANLDV